MVGTHLNQCVAGDGVVFFFLKPQRAAVRVAALQHVVAGACGEDQLAFLLHDGDALRSGSRVQAAGFKAVQLHAAGQRSQ